MTISCITLSSESIIALCALIVSIVSVGFVWFSLKLQKEHNYKSVKPIGIISAGDYENKIFIRIDNNGVGPLIIKKLVVKNKTRTTESVIDIIPDDLCKNILWSDFVAKVEGKAILNGQQLTLIEYVIDYNNKELDLNKIETDKKALRKALKDVTISLEYTDIYESTIFESSRSMAWFGRHFE